MEFKDYYQILGIPRGASQDDVKKAYRKLARKYHPDISKEPDAAKSMAAINEANAVLSDPEKRAVYDAVGAHAWARGARGVDDVSPPPGWGARRRDGSGYAGFSAQFGADGPGNGDFSDFFESLFGRGAAGHTQMRGQDQHLRVELDLPDAYRGAERTLNLRGAASHNAAGNAAAAQQRSLQVRIPKGVRQGQRIRLAGQGNPGLGGAPAGDLFLEVHFRPDLRWRVEGRDVTQKLRVAPWEAALGARVQVATPDGATVEVGVPSGSGNGRRLRLKGRGIPSAKTPGDLYLELEIVTPAAASAEQQTAWQKLAQTYPDFDPRRA
ncbi:MAG: DnaJ domain-containing protein [Burkholderiaceae bacterium]|jgi:curved DNA-binding protein|nr:DnaJ domain-containing protein [Burkholderiaceae bacterium]